MIRSKTDSPAEVISWMENEAASLWPALLGSLSYRRTRCGQPNCSACLSGEQHRSYVLYGRHKGRRSAIYVPEDLVEEVRRALDNGRALQDLLMQAGPRYVKALKRARKSKPTQKSKNG
ncbi:MAG TPA: DUF6788 family protein [Xanthobacteraceae bacterium]|jgi:hypothetical protein